jgi:sortase A
MKKLTTLLLTLCMMVSMMATAYATEPMEYTFDGTGDPEYGKPTSIEVVYTADGGAMKNEDVSKNAALAPPTFGSASADTLYTGTPLTPNLAPGYQPTAGAVINGTSAVIQPPATSGAAVSGGADIAAGNGALYAPGASTVTVTGSVPNTSSSGYTAVTDDLYYSGGYLGTLKIPAIGLNAKIVQGTDSAALAKGIGHFEDTSIWDGNAAFAAHNRGTNSYFGKIHTLELGDTITLTTQLGTRTYEVTSVSKVSETDRSALAASQTNVITLYTCVMNESGYRWCVTGVEV